MATTTPPPPTSPVSASAAASASPSGDGCAMDQDDYAEDECTIEFGEETPDSQLPSLQTPSDLQSFLAKDYQGEDFSQYLVEPPAPDYDLDDRIQLPVTSAVALMEAATLSAATGRRYQKKQQQQPQLRQQSRILNNNTLPPPEVLDEPFIPEMQQATTNDYPQQQFSYAPPLLASSSSTDSGRKSVGTIRERLGRFLSTIKSSSSSRRSRDSAKQLAAGATGTLHNFSFADSRIGILMVAEQQRRSGGSPEGSSLETSSDLGVSRQNWWDVGTLSSARSAQLTVSSKASSNSSNSSSNRISRWAHFRKKSTSVPNLVGHETAQGSQATTSERSDVVGCQSTMQRSSSSDKRSSASNRDETTDVATTTRREPANTGASPPPLPPLRDSTPETTQRVGRKVPGFLRKLTDKTGAARESTSGQNYVAGAETRRETTRRQRCSVTTNQEPVVNTFKYTRTYEEIPVRM